MSLSAPLENPDHLYRSAVRPDYVSTLALIGDRELANYHEQGFLAVAEGLGADEVDHALAGLADVVSHPNERVSVQFEEWARDRLDQLDGVERMDAIRRLMRFTDTSPAMRQVAYQPDIVAAVRKILGSDDVVLSQDMALLKPPGGGREKPWHQDKAFFNLDLDAPVVGVWIALDAATPENGCMHVIPGSHREGAMPHFNRRDFQICDTSVQTARDVVVPLAPGGLLFFDGYLQHGTPSNRTATRRRALQFHYVRRDTLTISEEERLAVFGLEGRGAEC